MGEHGIKKLEIERYAVGELDRPGSVALEEHLKACSACNGYYAQIKQEREAFLSEHPYSELQPVSALVARGVKGDELWYERLFGGLALPVLRPVLIPACLLLLVTMMVVPFMGRYMKDTTLGGKQFSYKGTASQPQLPYIYKRNGTIYESADGDVLQAGDKVQIFYASAADRFLTLVSIDTTGSVSFYQPDTRSNVCSIRSGVGKRLAYPLSIDLDDTPGAELVTAIFSETAFSTDRIKTWVATVYVKGHAMTEIEKAVQGTPPGGSSVRTLLLRKK